MTTKKYDYRANYDYQTDRQTDRRTDVKAGAGQKCGYTSYAKQKGLQGHVPSPCIIKYFLSIKISLIILVAYNKMYNRQCHVL